MRKSEDLETLKKMNQGDSHLRVAIAKESFPHFCLYYFPSFFTYKPAPFHHDFFDDCEALITGKLNEVAWIAFAESAKTTIAKLFVIYCIACNKKKYINYDSYAKENAEQALFDIVTWLRTNEGIKNDFGSLLPKSSKDDTGDGAPKLKRISSFITENQIKVEAFSTQESPRGRVFGKQRPDLFILDDIENDKTKESLPIIQKIISHFGEIKRGLSKDGSVLVLGNYITEIGVIDFIMKAIGENPKGVVRNIPVHTKEGVITWQSKYCMTDAEAVTTGKVSLETKKRMLNANNQKKFEAEMLNDPPLAGATFFDRPYVETQLLKAKEPVMIRAGLRQYFVYNPSHRYAFGADTSQGIGLDSNASVGIDFSQIPARVVACYDSNTITPDVFAYELQRHGNEYGTCLLAPEINAQSGGACITTLKRIYPVDKIYRQIGKNRMVDIPNMKIGWETTSSNKSDLFFQFKTAFESGQVEVLDKKLLLEIRGYSQADLTSASAETTRHFDLLTACVIAWKMRDYATMVSVKDDYKQPAYESPSFVGGFNETNEETDYSL